MDGGKKRKNEQISEAFHWGALEEIHLGKLHEIFKLEFLRACLQTLHRITAAPLQLSSLGLLKMAF